MLQHTWDNRQKRNFVVFAHSQIFIDSSNNLALKEKHKIIKADKIINVKRHYLSDESITISVRQFFM